MLRVLTHVICLSVLTHPFLRPSLWAEDSVWDLHQPPAGQDPCRDGRPWEDRGERDGRPDPGGWPGRPWMPLAQDPVFSVHQPGARRAERQGSRVHCPRTEELRGGGRRSRDLSSWSNIPPSQTSLIPRTATTGCYVSVLCFGSSHSSCCTYSERGGGCRRNVRHHPSQNLSALVISFCSWAIDEEDDEPTLDTQQVTLPNLSSLNVELLLLHIKMIATAITTLSVLFWKLSTVRFSCVETCF